MSPFMLAFVFGPMILAVLGIAAVRLLVRPKKLPQPEGNDLTPDCSPGFTPGSKLDKWFKHLTEQLGHEPSEAEFMDAVVADGKPCAQWDMKQYQRGKSSSKQIKCGKPATGWVLSLMAGPQTTCADCDPKFLGVPSSRFRPTDFEPGYYENM